MHSFEKPEANCLIVLHNYFILVSKTSVKQMKKAGLVLGLRKLIFALAIFRMYMQLHAGPNHKI